MAVAKLTDVQHAFWVRLGTLSVLRTSAAATGSTAMRALAGTIAGFVMAADDSEPGHLTDARQPRLTRR